MKKIAQEELNSWLEDKMSYISRLNSGWMNYYSGLLNIESITGEFTISSADFLVGNCLGEYIKENADKYVCVHSFTGGATFINTGSPWFKATDIVD